MFAKSVMATVELHMTYEKLNCENCGAVLNESEELIYLATVPAEILGVSAKKKGATTEIIICSWCNNNRGKAGCYA